MHIRMSSVKNIGSSLTMWCMVEGTTTLSPGPSGVQAVGTMG